MKYQNQTIGFYKFIIKQPFLITLALMLFVLLLGICVAPRDYIYTHEITKNYMATQELTERIENWEIEQARIEKMIKEAEKEIKEKNHLISLLSEVSNSSQ